MEYEVFGVGIKPKSRTVELNVEGDVCTSVGFEVVPIEEALAQHRGVLLN